ncbi:nuclear transport factor 2 family protein [Sphingomonas sp.]|uniref:nuclear transport factor 2 family protein n=1 Tax=Sphingomonas sp. TaxID=28214 RepID=UPI0025EEB52E|nr:nuclear transport factor 2 family protein [Sphingomonas sp.]MBV9528909.1 nuclear transport factor 2 family protein [Sphingomonas sp.]
MAADNRKLYDELEREWRDALCKKDMERLRGMMHERFLLIGSKSTGPFTMTRDEWLEGIKQRDVDSIEVEVSDATVLDQVLIGTVQARWKIKYLNRLIEDCVLLTDVWVLDGGRWQVIRRHSTPVPTNATERRS